jgi:hypothetical protein
MITHLRASILSPFIHTRLNVFYGEIVNDETRLSEARKMAEEYWKEIPGHFP